MQIFSWENLLLLLLFLHRNIKHAKYQFSLWKKNFCHSLFLDNEWKLKFTHTGHFGRTCVRGSPGRTAQSFGKSHVRVGVHGERRRSERSQLDQGKKRPHTRKDWLYTNLHEPYSPTLAGEHEKGSARIGRPRLCTLHRGRCQVWLGPSRRTVYIYT